MRSKKASSPQIPLNKALMWIFGSVVLVNGSAFLGLKIHSNHQNALRNSPSYYIGTIIQTGPEKDALSSFYLAEMLGLSIDKPVSLVDFSPAEAEKRLKLSPVIKEVRVKKVKPSSIYVDYKVRKPRATLGDFENIALDEEGVPFPIYPFFSPKSLPEIILGLPEHYTLHWGRPIDKARTDKAFEMLDIISRTPEFADCKILSIDVSNLDRESFGQREILVSLEDEIQIYHDKSSVAITYPRVVRLGVKDYEQQLGNYIELRKQLLTEEKEMLKTLEAKSDSITMPTKIIDLRISSLAFIK